MLNNFLKKKNYCVIDYMEEKERKWIKLTF